MQCPAKKFQLLFNYKSKRTVSELFFLLEYSCMNSVASILIIRHCKVLFWIYFHLISVFLHTVLYFIEKWFIVTNFTLPPLFRNPAISNFFFYFPWDFEIAGFNCTSFSQENNEKKITFSLRKKGRPKAGSLMDVYIRQVQCYNQFKAVFKEFHISYVCTTDQVNINYVILY